MGSIRGRLNPTTPSNRVLGLAVVLSAIAAGVSWTYENDTVIDSRAPHLVLVLPVLFAVAEIFVVHIHLRDEATSFSLSEVALVLGLVFVSPAQLVASRLVGGLAALVLHRHQRWLKVAFNLSHFALQTCVAIAVYRLVLDDASPLSVWGWLASLAATSSALAVGSIAVSLAIAVSQGSWPRALLRGFMGLGTFTTATGTLLGLVGVAALGAGHGVGWLLLIVSALGFVAYRSHARLRNDHRSLELIHDFTRRIGEELHASSLNERLARELAELLRADVVQLVLRPAGGPPLAVTSRDGAVDHFVGPAASDLLDVHNRLLDGRQSVLCARNSRLEPAPLPEGLRDAVLAELPGHDGASGSLLAGNRQGEVDTFNRADERLIATLANHATIVLRNAELVGRLRREASDREHEALHDALTGLGNRLLLDRRLRRATLERRPGEVVAVLLIDLDRFKEVNDTLGHHQGDVLLREIARRLKGVVGHRAVAIRLGGDEFAVLASGCANRHEVLALAESVEQSITAPFELGDVTLDVGASIGIALAPDDGDDPATLLQRADVAMYAAKSGTHSIELYDPSTDHYSPWRLALASELRRTVERRELLVEYQPKADLRTGAIVGVEALSRWHHPQHGFVPPDVFVPVAEHTGLIRAMTEHVLEVSLGQCRAWHAAGHELHVAVNLSVRNLLDDRLPEIVAEQLQVNGLPASALTLEITEGTIIADPARTVGILNRLSSMGVTLSIDDFGTGYSSLAYLKRLPVDELKIDRSFVATMVADESDLVIVRSTIELARSLGLTVTAEGVEDGATWQLLQTLGCHRAQGYFLGRPMTAARLVAWLRERAEEQAAMESLVSAAERPQP